MGKRLSYTPRSKVRAALRQLWLRSRERAEAIRRDQYTCQSCHKKQTKRKGKEFHVQVHHLDGIEAWDRVIDAIYDELLCSPDRLITLCNECHQAKEAER